jgi:hypothetical protein
MVDDGSAAPESAFDGASWVYLISSSPGMTGEDPVRNSVVAACEEGGWPVVSRPWEGTAQQLDSDHLFEDVRHAVEHADCVIALLGQTGESSDAELAIAYSHRRPIIACGPMASARRSLGSRRCSRAMNALAWSLVTALTSAPVSRVPCSQTPSLARR